MSISLFYRSMNTILICTHSNLDSEDSILDQRCLPFPPAHLAPKFSEFLVKRSRNFRRLLICQKHISLYLESVFFVSQWKHFFMWVRYIIQRIYKYLYLAIFSLKLGLTALITYLKFILLQCFQFSILVFSNKRYPNRLLISNVEIMSSCHGHNTHPYFIYIFFNY